MVTKVLFLCIHNSARSQMAEAYLKKYGGDKFFVESAGLEPGKLNQIVVEVMQQDGIDIAHNQTKDVFDFFKQGTIFEYVITVCDAKAAESCPIFPGMVKIINWSFDDPSKFEGTHDDIVAHTLIVRDKIKQSVLGFIKELENH
ncbi:MAG: arsenate reductase ArsC [Bacteroidota bacterium]